MPVLLPDWGKEQEIDDTELPWRDYFGQEWWKYAQVYGTAEEPDSKYAVAWDQLARFTPIALGDIDMAADEDLPLMSKREVP